MDHAGLREKFPTYQTFPFLQIPELLNSAILCKFYFLKFYLLPKIVIRDEPGIKISK